MSFLELRDNAYFSWLCCISALGFDAGVVTGTVIVVTSTTIMVSVTAATTLATPVG